jgi:hypothetical protein
MTDTWYYSYNEQRVGPFSLAGLNAALQRISDRKDLLVWRNGFSEWQRPENVREISTFLPTPPPIPGNSASESSAAPAPKTRRRTVAKVVGGIALLAAVFVAGAFATDIVRGAFSLVARPWAPNNAADIEAGFEKALVRMRAEVPKKIDEITTLTWVRYEGTTMIYENRLAINAAKVDDVMKGKIAQLIVKNVCATAETRRLLNLGASFRFVYSELDARPVMTVDTVKQNCS